MASQPTAEPDNVRNKRRGIIDAARTRQDAVPGEDDGFGRRFVLDFDMTGPRGTAGIRSGWIIRSGEDFPRLTSCYVR